MLEIQNKHLFWRRKHKSLDATKDYNDCALNTECHTLQFWKVFFDFAYYFLILPFRLKFNATTSLWELHRRQLQQVNLIVKFGPLDKLFDFVIRLLLS